jgi:hypothetical protein
MTPPCRAVISRPARVAVRRRACQLICAETTFPVPATSRRAEAVQLGELEVDHRRMTSRPNGKIRGALRGVGQRLLGEHGQPEIERASGDGGRQVGGEGNTDGVQWCGKQLVDGAADLQPESAGGCPGLLCTLRGNAHDADARKRLKRWEMHGGTETQPDDPDTGHHC